MEIRDQIRDFVITNYYIPPGQEFDDDTSFLDTGLIDSTGVLEVIAYIESTFHITIEDAETLPENLDSIARIAEFVSRKRTG